MPTLNLNQATKLYYGNTEAQKLYKGSQLLYSPPFSPLDLSPTLWLDASDSSTINTVSGAVSEWRDKSGNLRHATQTTAGNRPLFVANGLNGTSLIRFDGSGDFLKINSLFFVDNQFSIFYVLKINNVTTRNSIFTNGNNDQIGMMWNEYHNINSFCAALTGNFVAIPTTYSGTVNPEIRAYIKNGSGNHFLYKNAVSETLVLSAPAYNPSLDFQNTNAPSLIGVRNESLLSQPLNGDISQVIIFPRVLTQTEREKVEGYLAHKTGLQANLPITHPYKNSAP